MIKALIRLIEGPEYFTAETEAKTPMVGGAKKAKIRALTHIIPVSKVKKDFQNLKTMLVSIIPGWILEFDENERQYLIPKSMFNVLVEDRDIDDWNYLLERFNNLYGGLIKLLNNMRKVEYHKIIENKILEKELINRRVKINEKLLEKDDSKEEDKSARSSIGSVEDIENYLAIAAGLAQAPFNRSDVPAAKSNFVSIAKTLQRKYRLKDYQAAAIVGVWLREGLGKGRPDDIEDAYAAQYGDFGPPPIGAVPVGYGWAQWTNMVPGGRLDTVANGIGVTDRPWTEADNYAAFDWELQNKFPTLMGALKKTQTIDEAVQLFVHVYESGGDIQSFEAMHGQNFMPDRVQSAHSVLNGLTKQNATGAIIIPELLDQFIWYNTSDKTDDLANFIVDKPTIVDVNDVGEPLVVIPTQRPIGREILNILFREPFRKIEKIFERKEQKAKPQTPIENNNTFSRRSSIPESETPEATEQQSVQSMPIQKSISNDDIGQSLKQLSSQLHTDDDETYSKIMKITQPSALRSVRKVSNIDTVSQKTENVFGPKVILMTQDIYITEE